MATSLTSASQGEPLSFGRAKFVALGVYEALYAGWVLLSNTNAKCRTRCAEGVAVQNAGCSLVTRVCFVVLEWLKAITVIVQEFEFALKRVHLTQYIQTNFSVVSRSFLQCCLSTVQLCVQTTLLVACQAVTHFSSNKTNQTYHLFGYRVPAYIS